MDTKELDNLCKLTIDEFIGLGYNREIFDELRNYILDNWDSGKFFSKEYGIDELNS